MPKFVYFRCPDCGGTFPDLQMTPDDPPPDRCKLCKSWMSLDEPPQKVFVPTAPRIKKSVKAKSWDQVSRSIEASSIERAKQAADELGVPESEMSHLKITNMREPNEMREGDTAVINSSPIPQGRPYMSTALPGASFGGGMPQVSGYSPGSGAAPELGAVMSGIRSNHMANAQRVVANGNLNTAKPR